MPQSSRMIVTFWARRSQRMTSARRRCAAAGNVRMQIVRAVLLASRSIDRKGRSRGKGEMHCTSRVQLHGTSGNQVEVRSRSHPGVDRSVQTGCLVIDRDKTFGAARKCDRVGAVGPPV